MAFHESRVVIIETGRRVVRACLGLGEFLHVPSVEISARVGLRKHAASTSNGANGTAPDARVSDYLVGTTLDDALASGDAVEVYWPFADGKVGNWAQAEAIWKHILFQRLNIRRQLNECPVLLSLPAKLSRMTHMMLCRMFFERFNVAGFTFVERPLASLYAANLITGIVIDISQDETDIITCYESQLHHGSALSVPIGIRDCERHLAHLLRTNGSVLSAFSSHDASELDTLLLGLSRFLWQQGHVKIPIEGAEPEKKEEEGNLDIAAVLVSGKERALIEAAGIKKRAGQNKADKEREKEMATDIISVQFRDFPAITVGKERHRFCEPLFEPGVLSACSIPVQAVIQMDGLSLPTPPVPKDPDFMLPLQSAVHTVVKATPFSQRPTLYFGIVLTGQLANIHGLREAIKLRLAPFLCAERVQSETPVPGFQPNHAHPVTVPEYFAEFRDKGDLLSEFLGCGIVAKMAFGDSSGRYFVSKAEYGEKGPLSILDLTPTVL
ncbi:hypothetical protein M408DRAFT_326551 [Serendipita vermifera MAFF 305830]|uniref:Actin-related protein n=1 Tax=Serendipita vermifera MAFF 305830 TaxID=933852 RepID=A0A0C2X3P4_SERVB|nr:hypothetical protein M408DRAFT_326551 [Serendipita vermifera MAFF 305830]